MTTAHRFLMVAVLAASLVLPMLVRTDTAFACSCAVGSDLNSQLQAADVAFSGEVERIETGGQGVVGEAMYAVTFEVDEYWKGDLGERVTVYTATNSAACGIGFEEGTDYFVLAGGTDKLTANLCLFHANLDDGPDADVEAVEALGEGMRPQDRDDDGDTPASQQNGDDPDTPTDDGDGNGNGSDGGDDTVGSGAPGDGSPGSEDDGVTSDPDSNVDPDPVNVSIVVLASLVAAGAVAFVAERK